MDKKWCLKSIGFFIDDWFVNGSPAKIGIRCETNGSYFAIELADDNSIRDRTPLGANPFALPVLSTDRG